LENENFKSSATWQHIIKDGTLKSMDITFQAIDYYGKHASLAIGNNISDKVELEKNLAEERLKKQHEITAAAIIAQEQEKEDLGKELHDNINQILATTKLYIEYALANGEMRDSLLTSAKEFVSAAVTELRNLSKSLLPPSLGEVGLVMALDELVESIRTVNKFNLYTNWEELDESLLNEKLKLTIFRILQEQLNNIIKHADAKNAWIKIKTKNKRLMVDIEDDGVGFSTKDKRSGVGLKNITSRAGLHNGSMHLKSEPGKGCKLSLLFRL
jgi:signal transduction histidine kinase